MARQKPNLQTLYLSERISETFRHIRTHALTTVVAPMGYGKTTALNRYLDEQREEHGAEVFRLSIYSDSIRLFWHQFQNAFSKTEIYDALKAMELPESKTGLFFFMEIVEEYLSEHTQEHFMFIDDFHLLASEKAVRFLVEVSKNLPSNFHLIVAGRNKFIGRRAEVELGSRYYMISQDDLRLNYTEMVAYCKGCGVVLTEELKDQLFEISEGWFSGLYLCLRGYLELGYIPTQTGSIYDMMDEVLLEPITEKKRMFLLSLCKADEFTEEMAEYLSGKNDAKKMLADAISENAFITLLPDLTHYRFHHILKECTSRRFEALPPEEKKKILTRYAKWYEDHMLYVKAMEAYRGCEDWEGLFHVIGKDQGMELTYFTQDIVKEWIDDCPEDKLGSDPLALLVLMKQFFSWRLMPEMQRLRQVFLQAVENNKTLSEEEKNNLLGECEMVMSFTAYNSIEKMSEYHQSARKKMSRPAITMGRRGTWTFGSPAILAMYHRELGRLDDELAAMHRSMPYYYALTQNHGMGAEYIMEAEALIMRGDLKKARVAIEEARLKAESITDKEKEMRSILLCCLFVDMLLSLLGEKNENDSDGEDKSDWYAVEYEALRRFRSPMLVTTLDLIAAWYYSMVGVPERIPEWIREGGVEQANLLFPAKPVAEIIQNQVYLAKGDYAAVIAGKDRVAGLCQVYPYTLCNLILELQLAESYYSLEQTDEAKEHIAVAVALALPDDLIMPFAFYPGAYSLLPEEMKERVKPWHERFDKVVNKNRAKLTTPQALKDLTAKEQQVAILMAQGKKNKEIAEGLFLGEGTLKQYINRIYGKLELTGTSAEKREKLTELLKN